MSVVSRVLRRPGKAALKSMLDPFGYSLVPKSCLAVDKWMGLAARPIRSVLDIGACRGGFARSVLLPRFPAATIHSFEPSEEAFRELSRVAASSNGRIRAHNFGLGEEAGECDFHASVDALPASSLLRRTALTADLFPDTARTRPSRVEIRRLDDVAPSLRLEDDLLVKIDVQGFEDRVIRGGRATIGSATACVVEIQSAVLYEGQPTFHDIYDLLRGLGFRFEGCLEQHFSPAGAPLYFDAVFLKGD